MAIHGLKPSASVNASLDEGGETFVLKHCCHIGVAVASDRGPAGARGARHRPQADRGVDGGLQTHLDAADALSETLGEAAKRFLGRATHLPPRTAPGRD
jgi:hypothetical protein